MIVLAAVLVGAGAILMWRQDIKPVDGRLAEAMTKSAEAKSYIADSKDFDKNAAEIGSAVFVIDGDNWSMNLENASVSWIKYDDSFYILDTSDNKYWETPYRKDIDLKSRLKLEDEVNLMKDKISREEIKTAKFGSEPCGGEICSRWQMVDVDDTELTYYWWIGNNSGRIKQIQYVLGNGQTAIVKYKDFDTVKVEKPLEFKSAPVDSDPFSLPGILKF